MSRHSRLPTLKADLVTVLTALTGPSLALAGVQVSYGVPRERERQMVFFSGATFTQDTAQMPTKASRNEEGTFDVYVEVWTPGMTQQETTERAFAILAVIEDALTDPVTYPQLWDRGIWVLGIVPKELREAPDTGAETYVAGIRAEIAYKARL